MASHYGVPKNPERQCRDLVYFRNRTAAHPGFLFVYESFSRVYLLMFVNRNDLMFLRHPMSCFKLIIVTQNGE
uniref:Uncharacterized protein n=1 Tax=Salix viminalis TaxID=40686 RepID=A0A6N2K7U6_SALVM